MEFTLRTIVVLVLILVAALAFVSIMLGWNVDLSQFFEKILNPFEQLALKQ